MTDLTFKDIIDISKNFILIVIALFGVYKYWKDVDIKRIADALKLYNDYDTNPNCVLAMTMVDYYGREQGDPPSFEFKFHAHKEKFDINYTSELLRNALKKDYKDLNREEQAVRYIMDVWLGSLERIFYCFEKGYFHIEELVFYRYWLDLLTEKDDKFKFLFKYAEENTCGTFNPFLNKYKSKYKPKIDKWLQNVELSKHR